jgi:hypothetical protein
MKILNESMEERRWNLEIESGGGEDEHQIRGGRSFDRWEPERERWEGRVVHNGFDPEDDEELNDTLDDEDDTRSIVTAMPHSLERVDEDVAFYISLMMTPLP